MSHTATLLIRNVWLIHSPNSGFSLLHQLPGPTCSGHRSEASLPIRVSASASRLECVECLSLLDSLLDACSLDLALQVPHGSGTVRYTGL
jgi:hypothetical protein